MIPAGYMAKRIERRPDWLAAQGVEDIYSLSGCVSEFFCDEYVSFWKHNGFWLFNSPEEIKAVANAGSLDLTGQTLFYYEIYEKQFREQTKSWESFSPHPAFATKIVVPERKILEGYDVVTFSAQTTPECSPLSCNHFAENSPVNAHCLLSTLEESVQLIDAGKFENGEPGPSRIFAVYSLPGTDLERSI